MATLKEDIRQGIIDVLDMAGDDGVTLASIANSLKIGQGNVRPLLSEMQIKGTIRSTKGDRNVRFWIPSDAQLEAEARAAVVKPFVPLKMDRAKLERYAELDAARLSIKSIG